MANNPDETINVTIDKFIFKFPIHLRYSESGLWIKQEKALVRLGLSDFAQQRNGDIAFANLPDKEMSLNEGDEIATIETVKVNISLPSPLKGRIVETNAALRESPELINQDPYGAGWMLILEVQAMEQQVKKLLDASAYAQIAKRQAEAEIKQ